MRDLHDIDAQLGVPRPQTRLLRGPGVGEEEQRAACDAYPHHQARGVALRGPGPRFGRQHLPVKPGAQEPGDEAEIRNFCSLNYDVTFPMFAKIDVNGNDAHPLWTWLKQEKSGLLGIGAIKWNFSKFLVGRDGKVIKRYAPTDTPESLAGDIRAALA